LSHPVSRQTDRLTDAGGNITSLTEVIDYAMQHYTCWRPISVQILSFEQNYIQQY